MATIHKLCSEVTDSPMGLWSRARLLPVTGLWVRDAKDLWTAKQHASSMPTET